jgi:hypothetical protein
MSGPLSPWERVRVRAVCVRQLPFARTALTHCPSPKGRGEFLSGPLSPWERVRVRALCEKSVIPQSKFAYRELVYAPFVTVLDLRSRQIVSYRDDLIREMQEDGSWSKLTGE